MIKSVFTGKCGFWRYFGKFEAAGVAPGARWLVFAAIWGRFPFAAMRAVLQASGSRAAS